MSSALSSLTSELGQLVNAKLKGEIEYSHLENQGKTTALTFKEVLKEKNTWKDRAAQAASKLKELVIASEKLIENQRNHLALIAATKSQDQQIENAYAKARASFDAAKEELSSLQLAKDKLRGSILESRREYQRLTRDSNQVSVDIIQKRLKVHKPLLTTVQENECINKEGIAKRDALARSLKSEKLALQVEQERLRELRGNNVYMDIISQRLNDVGLQNFETLHQEIQRETEATRNEDKSLETESLSNKESVDNNVRDILVLERRLHSLQESMQNIRTTHRTWSEEVDKRRAVYTELLGEKSQLEGQKRSAQEQLGLLQVKLNQDKEILLQFKAQLIDTRNVLKIMEQDHSRSSSSFESIHQVFTAMVERGPHMVAIEDSIIDLCTQQEKLRKTLHDKRAAQLDMFAEESHETLSLSKVDFAVFLDQSKGVGEEQLNAMQNIYARSQTQLDEMMSSISSIQEAVDALPTQQSREREEVQKEEQLLTDRQLEHQQLIASLNARVQKAHTANANQKQQLEAMIDQQMQTNLRVKQTSSL